MELVVNGTQAYFTSLGSISHPADSDSLAFFPLALMEFEGIGNESEEGHHEHEVLTVSLQGLEPGTLDARVLVSDEFGNVLAHQVLVNGNGQVILQAEIENPIAVHFIHVEAADPSAATSVGNYEVSVDIETPTAELTEFVNGELTDSNPEHFEMLYVATPQLFHFLLDVPAAQGESLAGVTVTIQDTDGRLVHAVEAKAGETRSAANPLLQPGAYLVRVAAEGSLSKGQGLMFFLSGLAVSNPLGVLPHDPGSNPQFQCDGVTEEYCYPGGQTSSKPFFWDEFVRKYLDEKDKSGEKSPSKNPTVKWWNWYWDLQKKKGDAQADVKVRSDSYRVFNNKLRVSAEQGILGNDSSTNSNHLIATVAKAPVHGKLNLNSDGSFTYVPDDGFFGTDTFSYQAFDFVVEPSEAVKVTLKVSRPGDANGDHQVDFADFLVFASNFMLPNASWEDGDFTGDGVVDFGDLLVLSHHYAGVRKRE